VSADQLDLFADARPELLLDLDIDAVDERLAAELVAEFARAPAAPSCRCSPHGVHVEDEFGDLVCWLCGRPA
jgi:hypothetical protein